MIRYTLHWIGTTLVLNRAVRWDVHQCMHDALDLDQRTTYWRDCMRLAHAIQGYVWYELGLIDP